MKNIGSVKEDLNIEKRISITPETVKKFVDLNFSIFVEKNFGSHLGISDEEYVSKGAKIVNTAKVESSLGKIDFNKKYQFLRLGYFVLDKDARSDNLIFNQSVALRSNWK